jgi:8-hydroxy-5-deazaflavin:NADPH oxidoreductase
MSRAPSKPDLTFVTEPRWAAEAVAEADIVVLAIALHKFVKLDSSLVAAKLVIDAMNYWPSVDGVVEMFEDRQHGSSEIVQHRLASSTVVKTLNHIGYHELRLASLAAGRVLEPGGPVFGARLTRTEFELAVRAEATASSRPAARAHTREKNPA